MKIIVDTNIVFSAILNSSSKIGKLLTQSKTHFQFYSCQYLRVEILRHQNKLLKLTKLSVEQLMEVETLVTENIVFINEKLLPYEQIAAAEKLVHAIDPDDIPFIALAQNLDAKLWTGDKELINGLRAKRFKGIITTPELALLYDELEG